MTTAPGTVEFLQSVSEYGFPAILLQKRIPLPQFVVLVDGPAEQLGHRGVVGEHQTRHLDEINATKYQRHNL